MTEKKLYEKKVANREAPIQTYLLYNMISI